MSDTSDIITALLRSATLWQQQETVLSKADDPEGVYASLLDILAERFRQDMKWGRQDLPDGTGPDVYGPLGDLLAGVGEGGPVLYDRLSEAAHECFGERMKQGDLTFADVLTEEFYEALAEGDPARLYMELTQVAAVAVKWMQSIRRREGWLLGEEPLEAVGRQVTLPAD